MSSRLAAAASARRGRTEDGSTAAAVARGRHGLLSDHGCLYYALPGRREMLTALDDFSTMFGSSRVVVLAEVGTGQGDRAALLPTLKNRGTAGVRRHGSNCC